MILPPLALLAGGLSTRLYPQTRTVPKSMLDVAGKPFIAIQLALLKKKGISKAVICLGNLGELIEDFVKDGSDFGLSVEYSYDGGTLLGTGGAVKKALPLLGDEFWIMYGDTYLDIDLAAMYSSFLKNDAPAMMAVFKNEDKWDKSNVLFDGTHVIKYDKRRPVPEMKYIDYGLALLKKECFDAVPEGAAIDLADIYKGLVEKNEMLGYEVKNRFYEIGSPKGLEETRKYLAGH